MPARVVLQPGGSSVAFTLHTLGKQYQAAAAHCRGLGGTLASLHNQSMEVALADVSTPASSGPGMCSTAVTVV